MLQLEYEVWVGDAAQIRASYVRQQKTGERDAAHLLRLLVEGRFPRLWVDEGFRRQYQQHCHRMAKAVAKVAAGRKLAVRLYWMLRTETPYREMVRIESSPVVARVSAS